MNTLLYYWCANGACTPSPDNAPTAAYWEDGEGNRTYYKVESDGTVKFTPKDANDNPITTIKDFVSNYPEPDKLISTMGGIQGGQGQIANPLTGKTTLYDPGSFLDKLVEAFAGPHDTFNSFIWYDEQGNARHLDGTMKVVGDVMNYTNVLPAMPFAASVLLPPGVWNALGVTLTR